MLEDVKQEVGWIFFDEPNLLKKVHMVNLSIADVDVAAPEV